MRYDLKPFLRFFFCPDGVCPVCGRILFFTEDYLCPDCRKRLKPSAGPVCRSCGSPVLQEDALRCPKCLENERSRYLSGGLVIYRPDPNSFHMLRHFRSKRRQDSAFFPGYEIANMLKDRGFFNELHIEPVSEEDRAFAEGFLDTFPEDSKHTVLLVSLDDRDRDKIYRKAEQLKKAGYQQVLSIRLTDSLQ